MEEVLKCAQRVSKLFTIAKERYYTSGQNLCHFMTWYFSINWLPSTPSMFSADSMRMDRGQCWVVARVFTSKLYFRQIFHQILRRTFQLQNTIPLRTSLDRWYADTKISIRKYLRTSCVARSLIRRPISIEGRGKFNNPTSHSKFQCSKQVFLAAIPRAILEAHLGTGTIRRWVSLTNQAVSPSQANEKSSRYHLETITTDSCFLHSKETQSNPWVFPVFGVPLQQLTRCYQTSNECDNEPTPYCTDILGYQPVW